MTLSWKFFKLFFAATFAETGKIIIGLLALTTRNVWILIIYYYFILNQNNNSESQ